MTAPARTAAVVVGAVDVATAEEALRAAVGLTLRRARVHVVLADLALALGPRGARALATLRLFEHRVTGLEALREALESDVVEIWGPVVAPATAAPRTRPVVHLVRPGRAPAAVAPDDTVVDLPDVLDDDLAARLVPLLGSAVVW